MKMFKDAFFVADRNIGAKAVALPLAALIHGIVVLLAVTLPLLRTGDLPRVDVFSALIAPPAPTPPLPPPRGRTGGSAARPKLKPVMAAPVISPGRLVVPLHIPDAIVEEGLAGFGIEGGVEGGVDWGVEGVPLNSILSEALYRVIGEETAPMLQVGEIKAPRLVRQVPPVYPEIARQARVEGVVEVECVTDITGRVVEVKVVRSIPLLDQAAIDAVRQWVYEPLVINGRPRGVVFTVTVRFELKQGS
jgi:periplasmic protein TonB